ncbi:MAG: hypothetical protein KGH60_00480 [Candidatus Micrarchaeota archaeon]|nr:hypothetical protein [Candidatus Micrarchaeota archaeon]
MFLTSDAYAISVSLIAITLAVAGIILGLGYALDDKRLKEFGKSEIIQALISGAIIGGLILVFGPSGLIATVTNGIVSGSSLGAACQGFMSGNYAICFAYNYLVGLTPVAINGQQYQSLAVTSMGTLVSLAGAYTAIGMIGAVQLNLGFVSVSLSSVLSPIMTQLSYVIEAVSAALIAIEAQGVLLAFISVSALTVLLPAGLVLRTVYLTRRLGGALIAIVIGLWGVFPLTYVLNAQLISNYSSIDANSTATSFMSFASSAGNGIVESVAGIGQSNSTKETNGILSGISSTLSSVVRDFENLFNSVVDWLALLIIQVFFLPIFSLAITVISIKEFAKVLGTEIDLGRFRF